MKTSVWMSFDLGIRGDYENLFAWLDDHDAKEIGPAGAFLKYEYETDFVAELKADLQDVLGRSTKGRIYVVHSVGKEKGAKGQWIIGGRKAAPWEGFGSGNVEETDQ